MRTTLTLDPDLASALRQRQRQSGRSWKEVVNDAIRLGLAAAPAEEPREPYMTPSTDPGPPRLQGVHSVHELLVFAEGEDYR
ncbi:MAG: hypothetical protein ACI9K2_000736 [Myxococcota bacterium]|jgi:hypothetical protein